MDTLQITILDDGSIKVETDRISAANHMQAENFLKFLRDAGGGGTQEQKHKRGRLGALRHSMAHAIGKAHHHH